MARTAMRHRLVVAGALAAASVTALGASIPVAAGATTPRVLAGSVVANLPVGARVLGELPASRRLSIDVVLAGRDAAGLTRLVAELYDPHSARYHRFLSPAQFDAAFGAPSSSVARVRAWLRAEGLAPGALSASRLLLGASGTAATLAHALRTSFAVIALPSGRRAFANRTAPVVPAAIASSVTGIVGLDDLALAHSHLARTPRSHRAPARGAAVLLGATTAPVGAGPRACGEAQNSAVSLGAFTSPGIARYYAMTPLYALGDLGQGVRVGIQEFEPFSRADILSFQRCYATHAPLRAITVDGPKGMPNGYGSGESALDIENVIGVAPRASIDVFQTPRNDDKGQLDLLGRMVGSGDKVLTTSWGSCEPETSKNVLTTEHTILLQAQAQGQVLFAAAGDSGSTDCYPVQQGSGFPTSDNTLRAVDDPGSQQFAVSVGGTTAGPTETVWNDGGGAGGGGVSTYECMPSYQDNPAVLNLISPNPNYTTVDATTCPTAPSYLRQVPDVSAVANPATGYTVYWDKGWGPIGGTSGASPTWAAAAALVLASPYCRSLHATAGVTAESLYALAATPQRTAGLRDVTRGSNYLPTAGWSQPLYPAQPGYDEASGLGTLSLTAATRAKSGDLFHAGLASLLCYNAAPPGPATVTSVTPTTLASNAPTTLTISGTGFLPVAFAERVVVGGRSAVASCTSTTRCTAVVTGGTVGPSDLRVEVQSIATTPVGPADQVTFLPAPHVAAISARSGRVGARLAIRGSGFDGRLSVRFGPWAARIARRVSSSELIVIVPRGAGTVYVTVAARGGESAPRPTTLFRY